MTMPGGFSPVLIKSKCEMPDCSAARAQITALPVQQASSLIFLCYPMDHGLQRYTLSFITRYLVGYRRPIFIHAGWY